jgi:uncharacterized protein (DUF305 family)
MKDYLKTTVDSRNRKILFSVLAVTLVAATIFGLGTFNSPNSENGESQFNRADIMFLRMMIPHHEQAIEMAEMAPKRTDNRKVLALAENISTTQRQENQKMAEWLREVGLRPPERIHRMAGMASEQEMAELNQSQGQEFDRQFAELMIEHHEGGIHMANVAVQNGRSGKVRELAQGMIETQQKEINQMKEWRSLSRNS